MARLTLLTITSSGTCRTMGDEKVRDLLRRRGRDRQYRHPNSMLPDELSQFVHAVDRLPGISIPLPIHVQIEGGDDFESFLFEPAVGEQRGTKVAGANQDHGLQTVRAEQIGDHPGELLDVVAQATSAKLAKVGQIFAKLGWFHAGGRGERVTRHGTDAVGLEPLETAQLHRQAINRFARNFRAADSLHA
jgi:hypothetical protein